LGAVAVAASFFSIRNRVEQGYRTGAGGGVEIEAGENGDFGAVGG
jgi:hypothetical protein